MQVILTEFDQVVQMFCH